MTLVKFGIYPHTATYWGSPANDGSGGLTFDAPVAMSVRWEERAEQDFDENGELFISQARVYSEDTDFDIGGYLYLGTSVETDPTAVSGAYKIRNYRRINNLRGTAAERRATL
jgi:hypothetical protein